jgi:Asp-tRNA(Asn)/Glu-tRNA(Gln) amidotransferase A subunit family amidase
MPDALSRPIAEIAALLADGKLKARALLEEAITNHDRFGGELMAYSQWAPEHARACADAADAAFAVGSRGTTTRHSHLGEGSLCAEQLSHLRGVAQALAG